VIGIGIAFSPFGYPTTGDMTGASVMGTYPYDLKSAPCHADLRPIRNSTMPVTMSMERYQEIRRKVLGNQLIRRAEEAMKTRWV
jgi:hypothetical protein